MKTIDADKYFVRESLYNLVELSLLARLFEEHCLPNANASGVLNKESLAQTLLKMKATEGHGKLRVAIWGTDPVGFYWQYEGTTTLWLQPEHRGHGVENNLMG